MPLCTLCTTIAPRVLHFSAVHSKSKDARVRYRFDSNSERYRESDSAGTRKQMVLMCMAMH